MEAWVRGIARAVLVSAACVTLVFGLAWAAAWRVDDSGPRRSADQSWQAGSAADCEAMAAALSSFEFARAPDALPLSAPTASPGPCDWSKYDLRPRILTAAQFRAAWKDGRPGGVYIAHVMLSRPRYSLLHLRASVEVVDWFGTLGAQAYVCDLLRAPSGWRVQECRKTWIS
jgi:hypothetical protein